MQHIIFNPQVSYDTALLIKKDAFYKCELESNYTQHIDNKSIIGFDLEYDVKGKCAVNTVIKPYLNELLPVLDSLEVKVLLVADTNYFKSLTGAKKADGYYGYIQDCTYPNHTHLKVCLVPNYKAVFYDPKVRDKITFCIDTLNKHYRGTYKQIGLDIIESADYIPCDVLKVREALGKLNKYPSITVDAETFSLKQERSGIGTLGIAWDQHNGICIDIEHGRKTTGYVDDWTVAGVMLEIKHFLTHYKGNIKYHNATYDIKVLIRWLWMDALLDTEGLIEGLEVLTRDFDCTQVITYLATNSAGGNKLSLKEQAQEFLGNYAVDVNDITKVDTETLQVYNLQDCLATWFVYNKHWDTLVKDEQLDFYTEIAKPSLKNIIQMELTGMPLSMSKVVAVRDKLERIIQRYSQWLSNSPTVKQYCLRKREEILIQRNAAYKQKVITIDDVEYVFNTGSGNQVADLIHNYLGYEIFKTTPAGLPATGAKELKGISKRMSNKEHQNILKCIIKIEEGKKILGTFITKFIDSDRDATGWYWLFGSFKFGGAVSLRISSNSPNLMNLPAHGTMGKLVKSCFVPPPNFLFSGLDFSSLEDRINTILTQDPNKRKVYTDGYDGHSLRAYSYFGEEMPTIQLALEDERCFRISVEGKEIIFKASDTIKYKGKDYMGGEFYETYSGV